MNKAIVVSGETELNNVVDGNIELSLIGRATPTILKQQDPMPIIISVNDGGFKLQQVFPAECGIVTESRAGGLPEYHGAIEITPTTETQILLTENKSVLNNITINPIPNNYGLIEWNGSTLMVS